MFYAALSVYTRTLLKLSAVILLLAALTGPAFAANTGVAPQLVPYTVNLVGGSTAAPPANTSGFSGDGQLAPSSFLNAPNLLAVDAAGNIYFPDGGNQVIREINAQTGIINTVAGAVPTGCVGPVCAATHTGCSDGVAALGNPIGSAVQGIAVDSYGNIFFSDATQTISVIYRGGARVAAFIQLENPAGVTASGGVVKAGYVYHVAGTIQLSNCASTQSKAASTTPAIPAGDGNVAYQNATFGGISVLGLDSAGNIYVGDGAPNNTIRVINTQTTPQTIYGYTVAPGAIQSVMNCGSLTKQCFVIASPFTTANTGEGYSAGQGYFNAFGSGNGNWMSVDAYGNIYELGKSTSNPNDLAVAYAGGTALKNLINQALIGSTNIAGASSLTATPGDFYYLLQSVTLRPSSIVADQFGNLYYQDNHYGEVYRVDANAFGTTTSYLGYTTLFASARNNPATAAAPVSCYPINAPTPVVAYTGYKSNDLYGDGCPAILAQGPGALSTVSGYGTTTVDGQGNLFLADRTHNDIRSVTYGNKFPASTIGTPVMQTIQVHFNGGIPLLNGQPSAPGDLPIQVTSPFATSVKSTSSFSITAGGVTDFTISPTPAQFTNTTNSYAQLGATTFTSTTPNAPSLPVCANTTGSTDFSLDCIVNIIFNPTAPGLRQAQLVVTTAGGSVYNFGLSGIGKGGALAIDGGTPAVVPATGLGNTGQVAVSPTGAVYVADPANNRVVVTSPSGGAQATIGTGLTSPMGVAVDYAGNVYIADTGNNRIVQVNPITGVQTVLGSILATGTPAYTPYSFKAPQALAVDSYQNVYVADTGNKQIVMIPYNPVLGGATPLLQYPGAPTFTNPVGIAVDQANNVYVADTGATQIIELPPGGGDLQNLPGSSLATFASSAVRSSVFKNPSSVAVDGAGNLYVADVSAGAGGGDEVVEISSASGLGSERLVLNFPKLALNGTSPAAGAYRGGSVALDGNGNLYVSDSGDSRLLFDNRQNPMVAFGPQDQDLPAQSDTLTVTNIGTAAVTTVSPFDAIASTMPTGATSYTLSSTVPTGYTPCSTATANGSLGTGLHCSFVASFLPVSDGAQSAVVAVNGGAQNVALMGTGQQPPAQVVLTVTSPAAGPTVGQPVTVTATVTQPFLPGVTPTGSIAFSYKDSCSTDAGATATAQLVSTTPGKSTATFALPAVLQGRLYTVNGAYSGDTLDSAFNANALTFYIPGIPVTAIASSATFVYGQPVPALSGTVTGINATDNVTYKFVTQATPSTPIGVYPITVAFSPAPNACNYGLPQVNTSTGQPAVVTETPALLTVVANNATTLYGATPGLSYTSTVTGSVNGDGFAETYTPPDSSILNVGSYTLVSTLVPTPATGNYTVTVTNGKLSVTAAPTTISVSEVMPSVLPTALATDPVTISVGTGVAGGKGTPTGTVTLTDVFTPILPTAPGTGAALAPATIGPLTLVAGTVNYTPTSMTLGTHVYTVSYSGDANFAPSTTLSATTLLVDNQDFTVTSTTDPIQVAPGVLPGGIATVSGEAAATPQIATVTITSILSFTGVVTLTCQPQNPSYVSCALTPPTVTVVKPTTGTSTTITSVFSVQTPATLPLGFQFSELRKAESKALWAFLPLGALAFCFRRRKRLSQALWMLIALLGISTGATGCGANSVHAFTPIPAGPQTVTIFATGTSPTTSTVVTRSFTVSLNIQ